MDPGRRQTVAGRAARPPVVVSGVGIVSAADGDWKRGRVYYRMVCTVCHSTPEGGGKAIAPTSMTKAQWTAYLQADKHNKGKDSLKYYISKEYRAKVKGTNKAAEKIASRLDDTLGAKAAMVRSSSRSHTQPNSMLNQKMRLNASKAAGSVTRRTG